MKGGGEGLMDLFNYSIERPSGRIYKPFNLGMCSFYSRCDSNSKVGIFVDIKSHKLFFEGDEVLDDIIYSKRIPKGGHEVEILFIFYLS